MYSKYLPILIIILFGILQVSSPVLASSEKCPNQEVCCKEVNINNHQTTCEQVEFKNTPIPACDKSKTEEAYIDDIPFNTREIVKNIDSGKSRILKEQSVQSKNVITSMFNVLINWVRLFFQIH